MAVTYEPIATTTLTSVGTITFSSIPSTYTDIRLIMSAIGVSNSVIRFQFNGDTATNYSSTRMTGTGTAGTSSRSNTQNGGFLGPNTSGVSTTIPSLITADIFSYASSKFKTVLSTANADINTSGNFEATVSCWRSAAAITSILLYLNTNSFAVGTTATLYGIKAA
jgi:hypothetical protein